MNPAEDCLKFLQSKNWIELSKILSDNKAAEDLADSPTFTVFESVFIDELRRYEDETNADLLIVASRIFQIHRHDSSSFKLSPHALKKLARYLFDKTPNENCAAILVGDEDADMFLEKIKIERQDKIDAHIIGANLKIKLGENGRLKYDKEIFNSPPERELYLAAKKALPKSIILPNIALSTVIDSKICGLLDRNTISFFYRSTLDLCIANADSFMPELFIELDSSWHDKPRVIMNDKMKEEIFEKAGLKLYRLRKKENKEMVEIFELFMKRNFSS